MRLIYDRISPITGERSVLVEPDPEKHDNLWLCMDTGYHTYELNWKEGSDVIDTLEKDMAELVVNTKIVDDNKNVWYYITLINPFVMLSPQKHNDAIVWEICPLDNASDPNDPDIMMVIEGLDNEYIYRKKLQEHVRTFSAGEFSQAFDMYQTVSSSVHGMIKELAKSMANNNGDN
jgi:hypothetical protein